jgi:hypothetical protein
MADPLTITTGVLAFLGTCITVCAELKKLQAGAAEADTKIHALFVDVDALRKVLGSMEGTVQEVEDQNGINMTGHVGTHWKNLSQALVDGELTVSELGIFLRTLNKNATIFNGTRKHLRLQSGSEKIASYRQQIQSYKDTLQLSLQTITL